MKIRLPSRYEVVRPLGRGAMGAVILARDVELGRTVAIKVLASRFTNSDVVGARFQREAKLQGRIEHPGIVRLWDCKLDEDPPYLVMEYVEGEDLDAVLKREERLPYARVVEILRGMGGAIDALHAAGVVHRDLKPANVMIRGEDGHPLVMDLGLAQADDQTQLTKTGQLVGTPYYLPPEVARGEPWGPPADVYQLAAIVFECLAGTRLLEPGGMTEVLMRIANGVHRPMPADVELPDHARRALARGLVVDPGQRFATGTDFARAFAGEEDTDELPLPVDLAPAGPGAPAAAATVQVEPLRDERGAPRWLFALVGAIALAVGFGGWGGEGFEPGDVRFTVVGDALVVGFDAAGAEGVRLEVDGREVRAEAEIRDARRRLVHRGLPRDREVGARLVWAGGAGARGTFRGAGPAVRDEILLGPEAGILVEVVRPCTLRWEPAIGEPHVLPPGVHPVPLPPDQNDALTLVVVEEGVATRRELSRRELLRATLADLRESLRGFDPQELLRASRPQFEAGREQLARTREAFEPALPWIPAMLAADLPTEDRAWLLARWQVQQWGGALGNYYEDYPAPLELPVGVPGARFEGFAPWPVSVERTLPMVPVGGRDHDPRGRSFQLKSQKSRLIFDGPFATSADLLRTRWPEDAPRGGPVSLSAKVGAFLPEGLLRFTSAREGAPVVELWVPEPRPSDDPKYSGWLTVVLPGDLAFDPGEELAVRLDSIVRPYPLLGYVERLRVAWPG